jgi:HEPN pEK499 p136
MEPEDLVRDLAKRTRANLVAIICAEKRGNAVFPATQLVNSLLSLLVLPRQRLVIPETALAEIKAAGWTIPTTAAGYTEKQNLSELVIDLRNAVCHGYFDFIGEEIDEQREITGITFWNRKNSSSPVDWKASISIGDLQGFVARFADVIEQAELRVVGGLL